MDRKAKYEYNIKLRRLLKALREEAGLRQLDLAEKLDKPRTYVSKYELGEKTLDFIEVRELCNVFGISLAEFVQRFEKLLQDNQTTYP